jgi:hypothetical protein
LGDEFFIGTINILEEDCYRAGSHQIVTEPARNKIRGLEIQTRPVPEANCHCLISGDADR